MSRTNIKSPNYYLYARNNPINLIDYNGLLEIDLIGGILDKMGTAYDWKIVDDVRGYSRRAPRVGVAGKIANFLEKANLGNAITVISKSLSELQNRGSLIEYKDAFLNADKNIKFGWENPDELLRAATNGVTSATAFTLNFIVSFRSASFLDSNLSGQDIEDFINDPTIIINGKPVKVRVDRNRVMSVEAEFLVDLIPSVEKSTGKSSSPTKSKTNKAKGSSKKSTPPKYKPKPGIVIPPPPPPPPNEPVRSLRITDPSPNQTWDTDREHSIEWVSENIPSNSLVEIWFSQDHGATYARLNPDIPYTENDGIQTWRMWQDENICSDANGGRILIRSVDYPSAQTVSERFTINYVRGSNIRHCGH